eukprot:10787803-Heterocapsa_arctica.AAC.1
MCCKATGLMLADRRRIEPKLAIIKKVLANWLRQVEGRISEETYERCDEYAVYTGIPRRPINYFRREIKDLGWTDNTPTHITDHNDITRELREWPSFVRDGINRAKQLAWEKVAKRRPN